ncbi:MAG: hypothetical protein ACP5PA_05260, partial [Elusimicrobiales bacterium]
MIEFKSFDELLKKTAGIPNRIIVPGANNEEVMEALEIGLENKIISKGILIGPKKDVENLLKRKNIPGNIFELIDELDVEKMCNIAVELIRDGKGDFLVKGLVDTKFYMKAILRKD